MDQGARLLAYFTSGGLNGGDRGNPAVSLGNLKCQYVAMFFSSAIEFLEQEWEGDGKYANGPVIY